MAKRVFIVRHGETDFNAEKRWQGFLPTPLNNRGQEQARFLANHLRIEPIERIISSDLKRAVETARPTANFLGLDILLDERLREINLGIFQGLTGEEIQAKFPEEWSSWRSDYMNYVIPEGESREMVKVRVYDAWQELVEKSDADTILFVSHGGTIRMLMRALLGEGDWMHADFTNTSITSLHKKGTEWLITDLATTPHLKP